MTKRVDDAKKLLENTMDYDGLQIFVNGSRERNIIHLPKKLRVKKREFSLHTIFSGKK